MTRNLCLDTQSCVCVLIVFCLSSGPTASQQGMLWRTVGFLSVTLQRQNFQVLAGCAPSLAEQVEGRLGRPLSEALEFWPAAPAEALHRGVTSLVIRLLPVMGPWALGLQRARSRGLPRAT